MIIFLLVIIILIIAWPLVSVLLGGLFWIVLAHWELMLTIFAVCTVYIVFLSRVAEKHNLKLGGKMGEPLDPTKPVGRVPVRSPEVKLPRPFADRHREPEPKVRRFDER